MKKIVENLPSVSSPINCPHDTADCINPFNPNGLYYFNFLDKFISSRRGVWLVLFLPCPPEIPVSNVNCVDPDQTPHHAASDLGQHCLPMSPFMGRQV